MSMTCISTQKPEAWACPVCTEDGSSSGVVKAHCGHEVCLCCWAELRARSSAPKCPLCRAFYRYQINSSPQPTIQHEPVLNHLVQLFQNRNAARVQCPGCNIEKDDVKIRTGNYLFGPVVNRLALMRCASCAELANGGSAE